MARSTRQIERLQFNATETENVVSRMARLSDAGDGWINVIPKSAEDDDRPTSLRFFTLLSGGGSGMTMCTWVPATLDRRGHGQPTLGFAHVTGHRAVGALRSGSIVVPEGWFVEQDHPRRGLVLRLPTGESNERALAWALRALGALGARPLRGWFADVYLPLANC